MFDEKRKNWRGISKVDKIVDSHWRFHAEQTTMYYYRATNIILASFRRKGDVICSWLVGSPGTHDQRSVARTYSQSMQTISEFRVCIFLLFFFCSSVKRRRRWKSRPFPTHTQFLRKNPLRHRWRDDMRVFLSLSLFHSFLLSFSPYIVLFYSTIK